MPVNKRLMVMQEHEAGAESRAVLVQSGKLHNVRSALGVATMLLSRWGWQAQSLDEQVTASGDREGGAPLRRAAKDDPRRPKFLPCRYQG